MSSIHIKNASLILKNRILKNSSVLIDSKIKFIHSSRGRLNVPYCCTEVDAKGFFVSPGFIDCHIHGSPEKIFTNEVKFGTTSFVVARSCGSHSQNIPHRPYLIGAHFEGPYISFEKRGAQDPSCIKMPDVKGLLAMIKKHGASLKMMTVAPELEGALPLIRLLRKKGIVASIGHSNATREETLRGIDAGARHATHLFNAMAFGAIEAILSDKRVTAEIILDLVHVKKELVRALFKSKPPDNIILVTDSVRAEYPKSALKAGVYRLKNGMIAGSALTMIKAVENAVKAGGLSLAEAVRLATINPARLLGIDGNKGELAPGKDADIVIFDRSFKVKMTIARGRIIYKCAE